MSESTLRIGLLYPEVLGTYGDGGNALVLARRAHWRGIDAEIVTVHLDDPIPASLDFYQLGGGEDTAQAMAIDQIKNHPEFLSALSAGRPLLAICAGLQVLGQWYVNARGEQVSGVGILDCTTRPHGSRMIGELATTPAIEQLSEPLTGFENHGGATQFGSDARPLARVVNGWGNGSAYSHHESAYSDDSPQIRYDGVVQGSVVATYMHGPVLARNPQFADWLLACALGIAPTDLQSLGSEHDIDILRQERFAVANAPAS